MPARNQRLIRAASQALQEMKYELATELGINTPTDGYWGHLTTRENGSVGGAITQRLVAFAEGTLSEQKSATTIK
jgi:small acid-soluble spore protein A (major alpha-type SASP)